MHKKGDVSAPFHWIYVLVAGGVILLFFIGIVLRQKESSQKELSVTVLRKLDGIFTGAALSEQTLNKVDVPELELYFRCDDTGASEYQVGEDGPTSEIALQPFFGPSYMKTSQFYTWTLPFSMPFFVMNFLYLGSPVITTIVIHAPGSGDARALLQDEVPQQFNFQYVSMGEFAGLSSVPTPFVKLVFLDVPVSSALPPSIRKLPDQQVTAVEVRSGRVQFFVKEKGTLVQSGGGLPILSSFEEKNPSFYAAIFSDNIVSYTCNIQKAFRRMGLLGEIYYRRADKVVSYYRDMYTSKDAEYQCALRSEPERFKTLVKLAEECGRAFTDACVTGMVGEAGMIREENVNMQNANCPVIY